MPSTETSLFTKIRNYVKKIPRGRVLTYGEVAKAVGTKDARKVGWALRGNQNLNVPCHRVVFKDGSLAKNYSLGLLDEQKRRLEVDGIVFAKNSEKVDLSKYRWYP